MIVADVMALAQRCVPDVSPITMTAIARTESVFNPYAIGVVRGRLVRQPANLEEALATARALDAGHWNYSVGLAQVNRSNWSRLGLTSRDAFDACRNLAAGGAILQRCFRSALARQRDVQRALRQSLSCYASGDFVTGYRVGYVQRVVENATSSIAARALPTVPAIAPSVLPIPVVPMDEDGLPTQRFRPKGEAAPSGTGRSDSPPGEHEKTQDPSAVVF
jgi:type IV secretion system protein VirB1